VVELSRRPVRLIGVLSDAPMASPLVRLQSTRSQIVSNLRHESVRLTEAERFLVAQLDGSRSHDELLEIFSEQFPESFETSDEASELTKDSTNLSIETATNGGRPQILQEHLVRFARYALLVS
ncbi:MAG: hypothetical protein KDA72_22525, partial [Planctomycetales bacterium]|nr:hypothetical protein [Planctomycetales bacterium]